MDYHYNTGGREKYYKALNVCDCVVRAIAIAEEWDYKFTYNFVWNYMDCSPRNGVYNDTVETILKDLGWKKIHYDNVMPLTDFEIPDGIIICGFGKTPNNRRHVATVVDHVLNDTFDSFKDNRYKTITDYWTKN